MGREEEVEEGGGGGEKEALRREWVVDGEHLDADDVGREAGIRFWKEDSLSDGSSSATSILLVRPLATVVFAWIVISKHSLPSCFA